jgi:hypothetical protein
VSEESSGDASRDDESAEEVSGEDVSAAASWDGVDVPFDPSEEEHAASTAQRPTTKRNFMCAF